MQALSRSCILTVRFGKRNPRTGDVTDRWPGSIEMHTCHAAWRQGLCSMVSDSESGREQENEGDRLRGPCVAELLLDFADRTLLEDLIP